jgi:hypothetical protein
MLARVLAFALVLVLVRIASSSSSSIDTEPYTGNDNGEEKVMHFVVDL